MHKRLARHERLVARVQRSAAPKKVLKRRRPSKKLLTDIGALADALPIDLLDSQNANGLSDNHQPGVGEGTVPSRQNVKMPHKSLKSRPGAGKKKEKLLQLERERFAKNLALMATRRQDTQVDPSVGRRQKDDGRPHPGMSTSDANSIKARWAAIRAFANQHMEQRSQDT